MTDCDNPHFAWDADSCSWSPCTSCGQYAWAHKQADPLTDMYNTKHMWDTGSDPSHYPPAMKPDLKEED